NIREQSPDFAVKNPSGIEVKHEPETGIQTNQQKSQTGKGDHNAHQPRNAKRTKAAFKFVEYRHRSATVAQQSLTSILPFGKGQVDLEPPERKSWMFGSFPLLLNLGEDEGEESKSSPNH